MVKRLQEWGVPVYLRTRTNKTAGTMEKHAGWRTDVTTRKTIIDSLAALVREWKEGEQTIDIPSRKVIGQMKTFVVNEAGRPEAMPGAHDDDVMMLAIGAYNLRGATEYRPPKRKSISLEKLMKREGWVLG
jgi:phage terminase large subunit